MTMPTRKRQAGTTLVIGMIMLVLMTLLAVTSFNLGRGEYQIISNMQFQSEAASAAQMALEHLRCGNRRLRRPHQRRLLLLSGLAVQSNHGQRGTGVGGRRAVVQAG